LCKSGIEKECNGSAQMNGERPKDESKFGSAAKTAYFHPRSMPILTV
jgi:hypothetical protein